MVERFRVGVKIEPRSAYMGKSKRLFEGDRCVVGYLGRKGMS